MGDEGPSQSGRGTPTLQRSVSGPSPFSSGESRFGLDVEFAAFAPRPAAEVGEPATVSTSTELARDVAMEAPSGRNGGLWPYVLVATAASLVPKVSTQPWHAYFR